MAGVWKKLSLSDDGYTESSRDSRELEISELLGMDDQPKSNRRTLFSRLHVPLLYVTILALCIAAIGSTWRKPRDPSLGKLYTPAEDVVEYRQQTFTWNFWDKGEYMGYPTDEKDKLWSNLYNFGTSQIPNEDAKRLYDPTVPVPGSEENSLVMLDVWHQLHCLNAIRRALYPERWPEIWAKKEDGSIDYDTVEMKHIDHCIDHVRQALMCFGDVSPSGFYFDPKKGNNPVPVTTHMCRNFDSIRDWAVERQVQSFSRHDEGFVKGGSHGGHHHG